ncbi:Dihydroxyacetone kinase 2 [Linnemannia zychae]|nr:Dihydroxyacetone kinase 2 [Linnemannia zychae]
MSANDKHLVAGPANLVKDSLQGLLYANPQLALDSEQKVVYMKDLATRREHHVTLLCGGGSGHEPAHTGFVGEGMLTAAVCGHIFASPTSSQVLSCLRRIYSEEKGSLVVIKNYTGDVLNFGRAVERFKSERVHQGKSMPKVAIVVIGDDVGVANSDEDEEGGVGRRGIAGTILAYKLAGARAANGDSLSQVKNTCEYVASHAFTIGCALNAASVPGQGMPRTLNDDEIEIGMGIHNEPGFEKKKMESADVLISELFDHIIKSRPFTKALPSGKGDIVLLVNNLGAISNLELGLVTNLATNAAASRGLKTVRVLSGTYMTGLAMPGVSLTVLVLPENKSEQDELVNLLDQPAYCTGWINHDRRVENTGNTDDSAKGPSHSYTPASNPVWEQIIERAYNNVKKDEPEVTRLDQIMGDGDCGQVLLAGATAIYKASQEKSMPLNDPSAAMAQISTIVENAMGGTSGIIYCLFLDGLSQQLHNILKDNKESTPTPKMWGQAMMGALDTLYQYTTARPGHRTLIDVLEPFSKTLEETGDVKAALKAAEDGAKATATMKPKRGRAVYVGKVDGVVDAGAAGLVSVLTGIVDTLYR